MSDATADDYRREGAPPNPRKSGEPEGFWTRVRNLVSGHPQRRGLRRPDGKKPTPPEMRAHIGYWFVAFAALMLFQTWWVQQQTIEPVPYSQFLSLLHDHKIKSVTVEDQHVTAQLNAALPNGRTYVSTTAVPNYIEGDLKSAGVEYTGVVPSNFWSTVISWLLPLGIFLVFYMFVFRRFAERLGGGEGGLMSIGRSRAKIFVETDTKTTFADVAGADEAKEELQEIVNFLKDPGTYGRLGAHVPKGILLVGPPGTGKTLLARAVAGEAGVPFFSISGSEFVEMFVGVGAARVRDLFHQATERAPAIVFIDELDALGRARGAYGMGGHDEKEQTLNQLLVELDGFDPRLGVVLLAATNRPEVLDPALLRAGRFDRQVLVDRPDRAARRAIVALHLRKARLAADVDPDRDRRTHPGADRRRPRQFGQRGGAARPRGAMRMRWR